MKSKSRSKKGKNTIAGALPGVCGWTGHGDGLPTLHAQAVTGGTKDAGGPLNPGLWDVGRFFRALPCRITRTGPKEPIVAKGLVPAPTGPGSRRLKTGVRNAPLDQGEAHCGEAESLPWRQTGWRCENQGASDLHLPPHAVVCVCTETGARSWLRPSWVQVVRGCWL